MTALRTIIFSGMITLIPDQKWLAKSNMVTPGGDRRAGAVHRTSIVSPVHLDQERLCIFPAILTETGSNSGERFRSQGLAAAEYRRSRDIPIDDLAGRTVWQLHAMRRLGPADRSAIVASHNKEAAPTCRIPIIGGIQNAGFNVIVQGLESAKKCPVHITFFALDRLAGGVRWSPILELPNVLN